MKAIFSVTYEIADKRGLICEGATLRDALKELHTTRTAKVDGVECIETDSSRCARPRWVTVVNGREFETGAQESRTLHSPHGITAASSRRLARLAGWRA